MKKKKYFRRLLRGQFRILHEWSGLQLRWGCLGKLPIWRLKMSWECNIKLYLSNVGCEDVRGSNWLRVMFMSVFGMSFSGVEPLDSTTQEFVNMY